MTIQEIIVETQTLMSENRTEESLTLLINSIEDEHVKNEVILLKGKLYQVRKKHRMKLITNENLEVEETKIGHAILLIVNSLDDEEEIIVPETTNDKKVLEELLMSLQMNYQAYKNIRLARERLVVRLEKRIKNIPYDNLIDLFSGYYSEMTKEELRDHQIMRNFTKNILYPHNEKVLKLLQQNPSVKACIPLLNMLEIHLVLWKNKYESIFANDEAVCTIYVMEKESRFPKGIEKKISNYLKKMG